jgi:NADP-reducing hydrogenase subunit HndB
MKITSPDDLKKLREQVKGDVELRSAPKDIQITVHMGTCGIAAGAREVLTALSTEIAQVNVSNVTVRRSGCAGLCDQEPMLTMTDSAGQEFRYVKLNQQKVHRIVQDHLLTGNPVLDYLIHA